MKKLFVLIMLSFIMNSVKAGGNQTEKNPVSSGFYFSINLRAFDSDYGSYDYTPDYYANDLYYGSSYQNIESFPVFGVGGEVGNMFQIVGFDEYTAIGIRAIWAGFTYGSSNVTFKQVNVYSGQVEELYFEKNITNVYGMSPGVYFSTGKDDFALDVYYNIVPTSVNVSYSNWYGGYGVNGGFENRIGFTGRYKFLMIGLEASYIRLNVDQYSGTNSTSTVAHGSTFGFITGMKF